jgi:hypothetical protein
LKNGEYDKYYKFDIELNLYSPQPKDDVPQASSLVNDNDTTVNLAQIERVNSLSMFNFNPKFKRKRIFLYYRSTS